MVTLDGEFGIGLVYCAGDVCSNDYVDIKFTGKVKDFARLRSGN